MKFTKKQFKIAEVLAAFFTGSQTERDEEELGEWVKERKGNEGVVNRLLDKNTYEENRRALDRFPVSEVWNAVDGKLGKKSRSMLPWKQVMKYAAVVFVLLSAGLLFWWNNADLKKETPVLAQITAGTTGAKLILGDGSVVDIVKDKSMELKEADGTTILTDSVGIDYLARKTQSDKDILNTVQTLTGMEYTLTLSDGTKVYLNAETKLRFPTNFKGEQRVVELEGEAYFKVSKDAAHPFIVKTGSMAVRVLGTSFNVRSYEDEQNVVTTLIEGKVAVSAGKVNREIVPGEQAIYMKESGKIDVKEVDVALYTAWQSGAFIFKNENLEDILAYLSKWYGFTYRFIDENAKKVQIGARLNRYHDMTPIIEMLRRTGLVNVTQVDNMLYISSAK